MDYLSAEEWDTSCNKYMISLKEIIKVTKTSEINLKLTNFFFTFHKMVYTKK